VEIERLQIEGGFLDGVDVKFAHGLNVIIGARGTGKTSVIELLRFALGVPNHTLEASRGSEEHAAAVLDDGEVTVQVGDLFNSITVSRVADQAEPQSGGFYERPLIFSQTEIESIGLSENGRLSLLDGFLLNASDLAADEAAAVAAIKSIFKEIRSIEAERSSLAAGLDGLSALKEQIKTLEKQEAHHQAASSGLAEKQRLLASINEVVTSAVVREGVLGRFAELATNWVSGLNNLVTDDFGPEEWDSLDGPDPLAGMRSQYLAAVSEARSLEGKFTRLINQANAERAKLIAERLESEAKSRSLRAEVEKSTAGAGAISRQLSQLRTQVGQLNSKSKVVADRDQRIRQLRIRRDERIKALDAVRLDRFKRRSKVAAQLSKALAPQVKITVERYGQYAEYIKALTEALRGSGMRYTDLVASIVQSVDPHGLLQFLDANDFEGLAEVSGIPKDRAARLLGHLREIGASEIVTVSIEDNVRLSLLDGVDFKDVEVLSAGQRCTVILSIVLQHTSKTLVIDQPEDHLDNAYIATTVIKAIRSRKGRGQLIISTHNANIPVLGGADQVIEMTSDGRNGYVQVCEKLTNPKAIDAITNVMEGGREAFIHRATFYDEHER
jgi:DNA repair exonuclease SbcCD ATPase subunit